MKKIIYLFIALTFILNLSYGKEIVLSDSYNEITIDPDKIEKIISLAPNITEIIYALHGENKLIGRTNYCDYPKEVINIISVGEIMNPSIEMIIGMKPDIVIASNHVSYNTYRLLVEQGIKVFVYNDIKNIEDIYDLIEKVGKIINKDEKAIEVISELKGKIEEIKTREKKDINVYYMLSYGKQGDYTAGGDTFLSEIIDLSGAINVSSDVKGWKYSLELLLQNNPDIILTSNKHIKLENLKVENGYKNLDAIKKGNLYYVDENLIVRPGPRIWLGIDHIRNIIDTF